MDAAEGTPSRDLWGWATHSNARPELFAGSASPTALPGSTFATERVDSAATTRLGASPTLTAPIDAAAHVAKTSFPIGIPIGVSLGVVALLAIVLGWLGKKGKLGRLGKLSPYQNPYKRRLKREAQMKRLEEVEAARGERGVELRGREEVPVRTATAGE